MTFQFQVLSPAEAAFDSSGTPFSLRYGDVYHARQGALRQAGHVFLGGNGLPGRWRGRAAFTVCETGFGLGQNFLALWHAWRQDVQRSRRLHVISIEAHPFRRADLARMLLGRLPPDHEALARQLLEQWPPLLPGLHRLEFQGGDVTLTLVFGPVDRVARLLQGTADAFFLDGFAPRRNPEMWTRSLFGQLVRLAARGATAATWCTAGGVRRALSDAGFLVSKAPGLGRRDMTVAVLRPNLGRLPAAPPRGEVLVIGGGIAGAGIAHSLALRGQPSLVVDPVFAKGLGASHAGHCAAALTPLVSRDDDFRARLSRAGSERALRRWQPLAGQARPLRCGGIEVAGDAVQACERRKTLAALSFPEDWVRWLDGAQASERAGLPMPHGGVYFAQGQLVRPQALVESLLARPGVRTAAARVARLLPSPDGGWQALDADGRLLARACTVVLAGAAQAPDLLPAALRARLPKLAAMQALAGQVNHFSPSGRYDPPLVVSGEGYWLPRTGGLNVGGSTYVAGAERSEVTADGLREIAGKLAATLGLPQAEVLDWAVEGGWAGWRATVAGRLPVIGPLEQASGMWLACAYGSRGLTWSALAGDLVAAALHDEPVPLERDLLRAVAPR